MLVTNEDQIPIVEIDDSHASSITQDFLWFTKVHWVLVSFFPYFAPGLLHINLWNFSWGGLSRSKFWGGSKLSQDPLWPQRALCHFFSPESEVVSPLHFQSKDACILSDCVSALQSYGFIWQRLKCRSDCFISIQIFFQLDRDQKVVSSVSENGLEYKYRGRSGFLLWPCFDATT